MLPLPVIALAAVVACASGGHLHSERSSYGRLHSFAESRAFREALRRGGAATQASPSPGACAFNWTHTLNGYIEACGGVSVPDSTAIPTSRILVLSAVVAGVGQRRDVQLADAIGGASCVLLQFALCWILVRT